MGQDDDDSVKEGHSHTSEAAWFATSILETTSAPAPPQIPTFIFSDAKD